MSGSMRSHALQHFLRQRLRRTSRAIDAFEHGDVRIIAIEEEIVRETVGIGVHQDGAAMGAPSRPARPISW